MTATPSSPLTIKLSPIPTGLGANECADALNDVFPSNLRFHVASADPTGYRLVSQAVSALSITRPSNPSPRVELVAHATGDGQYQLQPTILLLDLAFVLRVVVVLLGLFLLIFPAGVGANPADFTPNIYILPLGLIGIFGIWPIFSTWQQVRRISAAIAGRQPDPFYARMQDNEQYSALVTQVTEATKKHGRNHANTATAQLALGRYLLDLGAAERALPWLATAAQTRALRLGAHHPDTLAAKKAAAAARDATTKQPSNG